MSFRLGLFVFSSTKRGNNGDSGIYVSIYVPGVSSVVHLPHSSQDESRSIIQCSLSLIPGGGIQSIKSGSLFFHLGCPTFQAYGFHGREFQSLTKEAFIIILDSY
ncbi:unnamed protein product [Brassica rapa subsp. narinosa]